MRDDDIQCVIGRGLDTDTGHLLNVPVANPVNSIHCLKPLSSRVPELTTVNTGSFKLVGVNNLLSQSARRDVDIMPIYQRAAVYQRHPPWTVRRFERAQSSDKEPTIDKPHAVVHAISVPSAYLVYFIDRRSHVIDVDCWIRMANRDAC